MIPELGISVDIKNVDVTSFGAGFANGGTDFVGATMTFKDSNNIWLRGLQDQDGGGIFNWIRAGNTLTGADSGLCYAQNLEERAQGAVSKTDCRTNLITLSLTDTWLRF